jgi:hypothetical protein
MMFIPNFIPVIMADGFDILLGRIEVTVPWVFDGDDYQIVRKYTHLSASNSFIHTDMSVFGDSGNFSPKFSIRSR